MDVPCREVLHKRQTILDKLESREVVFCHLENWEVSSNEVSIGISFPAKPKTEGKINFPFYFYWTDIVSDNRETGSGRYINVQGQT